jgi:predicted N-acyltransferase
MGRGLLRVERYARIEEIPEALWDSFLDPDDLQATHRFVEVCQQSEVEGARYFHLLVHGCDRLEAVASLCLMDVRLDLLAGRAGRAVAAGLRRLYPRFLRTSILLCGLPVSFGGSCLRIRPGAPVEPVLERITDVMEEVADESGVSLLAFKELGPGEAAIGECLVRLGYVRGASLDYFSLPIRWRSFDEYLARMRAGYRRQVRESLRVRECSGLEVRRVEDFGAECGRIFALYGEVMSRAEFQLEVLNLRFFELLDQGLGRASRAILLEREGELAAAAVLLEGPRSETFLLAGIDYASNREHHAYLNLVLEIVADAIRSGAATLHLGQTSERLKTRLGAIPEPRTIYLKHRQPRLHRVLEGCSGLLFPERAFPPRRVFRDG